MKVKIFQLYPEYGTNTYLVYDEKQAIVIDPAGPPKQLLSFCDKQNLKIHAILLTHGHGDHIGGVEEMRRETKAKVYIHQHDADCLTDSSKNLSTFMGKDLTMKPADIIFKKDEVLKIGVFNVTVLHTPGHTKGGCCFLIGDVLFSGDSLFDHSIGRTDLPGGDHNQLLQVLKNKIMKLPEKTIVYPGHGPSTTIEDEAVGNPFIGMLS